MEPANTEMVYQISDDEQRRILQSHFALFYNMLAESRLIPEAAFESKGEMQCCLSGAPMPYLNAVLGYPKEGSWDGCIDEQIHHFNTAKVPFVWYLDEESDPEFKQKLLDYGFQDGGIFRGVLGILDKPIPNPEVPEGCTLELVASESCMKEFSELVCDTFGFQGIGKDCYNKLLREFTGNTQPTMFHWVARKDGKVVSAVSTLIDGPVVSFWNGASLPEVRRQGFSTALRHLALQHATAKGCHIGVSYLMSEGLAFGICSKLGYQTKWRFNVFLSPDISNL